MPTLLHAQFSFYARGKLLIFGWVVIFFSLNPDCAGIGWLRGQIFFFVNLIFLCGLPFFFARWSSCRIIGI